jgi:hypothetical protein
MCVLSQTKHTSSVLRFFLTFDGNSFDQTVLCLEFHPTEPHLVTGGQDGIIIWNYLDDSVVKKCEYDSQLDLL